MAATNYTTTFWHFLENYSIEIPIIQRDYAQGRIDKENLRKNFLGDLKEALDNKKEMKLDFVYGSTEKGKLFPLDGQQRLTTLWLLHWYIALVSNKLEEASKNLKNFSYETRVSSRDFCEAMCNPDNFISYNHSNGIVEFITNQTWFYSAWKQDPTIQAMLRMLGGSKDKKNIADGIEKVFCCIKDNIYYNLLTGENCPIVFYYLPKDFGNSDELYIKMNARGEQLTSLENFKADLIGYIKKQAETENDGEWKTMLDSKNGIPIKMDTTWTDIFWGKRSVGTNGGRMANHIDEIYFAFLNRFFWNELFIAKNNSKPILDIGKDDVNSSKENDNASYKYLNDSDNPNDYDTKIAYKGFDVYKYHNDSIPIDFFKKLKNVMNNLYEYFRSFSIPECSWNKDFFFIPTYDKDKNHNNIEITNNASDHILRVTILNQVQRIVFFSICKYFDHDEKKTDDDVSLKRWLRVVWNLVSGEDENGRPQIRSTQAMRTAIDFIEKLDSHDVYSSLKNYKEKLSNSDFDEKCKEEIEKAKQILNDNNNERREYNGRHTKNGSKYKYWEDIIIDAEDPPFFKGTIRFLFQDEKGEVDQTKPWNTTVFDNKWEKAKEFFDENNIIPTTKIAEYFTDDQIKDIFNRFSFDTKNWKTILLQKSISGPIHRFLLGEQVTNYSTLLADIKNILDNIDTQSVWLLQDWQRCKVVLTNYLTRRSEPYNGYVYQVGNDVRNKFVSKISKNDNLEVSAPQASGKESINVNGQVYYRGLWTDIKYNKQDKMHFFRLFGNNYIFLLQEEKGGKKLKNNNKGDKLENTYFFNVSNCFDEAGDNANKIFHSLDCLIAQAYPEESDKTCCSDCQDKICE